MGSPNLRPAELDETSLSRLRRMEQELGSVIIAYQADTPFSHLSDEQLDTLQKLEQELGVVLLAFKPQVAAVGE